MSKFAVASWKGSEGQRKLGFRGGKRENDTDFQLFVLIRFSKSIHIYTYIYMKGGRGTKDDER